MLNDKLQQTLETSYRFKDEKKLIKGNDRYGLNYYDKIKQRRACIYGCYDKNLLGFKMQYWRRDGRDL